MAGPAQCVLCMHGALDGWPCAVCIVHAWSPGPWMVGPAQYMHGALDGRPYIYKMCADLISIYHFFPSSLNIH